MAQCTRGIASAKRRLPVQNVFHFCPIRRDIDAPCAASYSTGLCGTAWRSGILIIWNFISRRVKVKAAWSLELWCSACILMHLSICCILDRQWQGITSWWQGYEKCLVDWLVGRAGAFCALRILMGLWWWCLVSVEGLRGCSMQLQMQIPSAQTGAKLKVWGQAQVQKPLKSRYVRQDAKRKTLKPDTTYCHIDAAQTLLSVKLWKQPEEAPVPVGLYINYALCRQPLQLLIKFLLLWTDLTHPHIFPISISKSNVGREVPSDFKAPYVFDPIYYGQMHTDIHTYLCRNWKSN